MFEKYFEYILISLFILFVILITYGFIRFIRLKYLQKLIRYSILKKQQQLPENCLYSSYILDECTKILFYKNNKKSRIAILTLANANPTKAIEYFSERDFYLSCLLQAHFEPQKIYKHMLKSKRKWLNHKKYVVFFALMAHLCFDEKNFIQIMQKIKAPKINSQLKAYYQYISAYAYLKEADMLSASQNASLALKNFKKYHYLAEEGFCYLLLAEIYRLSCVNDIAQTMVDSAIKIFSFQKLSLYHAQALATAGRLMLFENRHEEAEDKFNQAITISSSQQIGADILNQLSLLHISKGNISKAEKLAKEALVKHQKFKSRTGEALSLQLLGQIKLSKKQYNKSVEYSKQAAEIYHKLQNHSAYAESLYVISSSLFKNNKYQLSEKYLRKILDLCRNHPNNFHQANAYSLLGLIYQQTGDLQRAKVLFQQSLHLEQSNERCQGMVADYTNLAIIDEKIGNLNSARANIEIALEYAQKTEDVELIKLIKSKKIV